MIHCFSCCLLHVCELFVLAVIVEYKFSYPLDDCYEFPDEIILVHIGAGTV